MRLPWVKHGAGMSDRDWLKVEKCDGGVSRIALNRAPVNALTPEFLQDFAGLLRDLEGDAETKAVVLASPFKVFSAGLDLKEAREFDKDAQQAIVKGLNDGFEALYRFSKPTVVAVNGAAIAGGLFFVLAADHRIADPRAKFGLAEVRVGPDFPVGPLEIARQELAPADLRRLMLSGKPMSADQALAAGIVDRLSEGDQLQGDALRAAQDFAKIPPKTYASVKRQIRGDALERIKNGVAREAGKDWYNEETRAAMAAMIG